MYIINNWNGLSSAQAVSAKQQSVFHRFVSKWNDMYLIAVEMIAEARQSH